MTDRIFHLLRCMEAEGSPDLYAVREMAGEIVSLHATLVAARARVDELEREVAEARAAGFAAGVRAQKRLHSLVARARGRRSLPAKKDG